MRVLLIALLAAISYAQTGDNGIVFPQVGIGSVGVRGFNVQFEIEHGSSEFSKIYWVVTDANIAMSVEDILAGRNATQPECIGEYTPTDVEIQTIEVVCPMEANSEYIFWVAINLNGEGARHIVDTGFPIFVQNYDSSCQGSWGACKKDCTQVYIVEWGICPDENKVRKCAYGEDECRSRGSFIVHHVTPEGFTFHISTNPEVTYEKLGEGAVWYYAVLEEPVSSLRRMQEPTRKEIIEGVPSICHGVLPLILDPNGANIYSIDCELERGISYIVWVAESYKQRFGEGDAAIVVEGFPIFLDDLENTGKIYLPFIQPSLHIYAHDPTDNGLIIVYDIANPILDGNFYYLIVPTTTVITDVNDIEHCKGALADECCGTILQSYNKREMESVLINCPLQVGKGYDVWGAVDIDHYGTDASLSNSGQPFTFIYPREDIQNTSEVDVLPPVHYEVLYSNEVCDPELSSMIPLNHPMDVQSCANSVLRNYGKARGCSKVFVYAHPNWCMCVRYGDECARRDSGGWVSIYKMCPEEGCIRHPGLDDVIILEKVDANLQLFILLLDLITVVVMSHLLRGNAEYSSNIVVLHE